MAEDFGKKVERFGQDIWKKTSDAFGVISKSTEVASKRRELRLAYADVGSKYCELHGGEAEPALTDLVAIAKVKLDELHSLEEQLLEYKGYRKCAACGETISSSVVYCPHCGAQQPKEAPAEDAEPEVDADWTCPRCGVVNDADNLYCVACGEKRS